MGLHDQEIKVLLDLERKPPYEQTYCLTLYQPNHGVPKGNLLQQVRLQIIEALRQHKFVGQFPDLHQNLADSIISKLEDLDELGKGIAFFCVFDPTRDYKKSAAELVEHPCQIVVLAHPPVPEITISRVFDLDQLLWANTLSYQALVIQVDRHQWNLYLMTSEQMTKLEDQVNPYAEAERPDEHLGRHVGSQGGSIVHGTATEKLHHREAKENQQFLMDLADFLKEARTTLPAFEYVVVGYSEVFREYIKAFQTRFHAYLPDLPLIFIDKNVRDVPQLHQASQKLIDTYRHQQVEDLLHTNREQYPKYTEEWVQIVAASRDGNIRYLFVPSKANSSGYVLNRELPYIDQVNQAVGVRNLVPWVVKRVVETDGQVLISDFMTQPHPDFAAVLRY
jgi:hypothetical protein